MNLNFNDNRIPAQGSQSEQQPRFKVIHNRTGRVHVEAGSLAEIMDLLYEPLADQFTIHDKKAGDFFNGGIIFNKTNKTQKK